MATFGQRGGVCGRGASSAGPCCGMRFRPGSSFLRRQDIPGHVFGKAHAHYIRLCPDVLQNTVQVPHPELAVLGSDGCFHIGTGEEQGRELVLVKNVNIKMDGRMAEAALPQPADGGIIMGQYAVNVHKGYLFRSDRQGHCACQQGFAFAPQIARHMAWAWSKSLGVVMSGWASMQVMARAPAYRSLR